MAILPLQLARVSNTLRTSVATGTMARTQQSLLEVQNQLSTGKRLNAPSDDAGDAAGAMQLRKLLEQRDAYATNLKSAGSQLSEVDSTLGDVTDLLQQAQTLAQANVGSDVTSDERAGAAAIVDALYRQMLDLANHQFDGVYLFGGDRSTSAPFIEAAGGVKFVGTDQVLKNTFDENVTLPFMVDGEHIFGAMATRVEGSADLTPTVSAATRLIDLRGVLGNGIQKGPIQISNGATSAIVDLTGADTLGDIITAINGAAVGGITAAISADGSGITLTGAGTDNISVNDLGGATTASDLGIQLATGTGDGNPIVGASVRPRITELTTLASLRGGAGIDTTNGLTITNGTASATIDLSGATTVEDMLNAINGSGVPVRAEINAAGTGINILNPTQGTTMTIAEAGGTTAADLGVRSFGPDTPLSELNFGKGVRTADGSDIQLTDSNGVAFEVDLTGTVDIQGVIDAINLAATTAGAGVTASFATNGNGIVLTDTAAGAGALTLVAMNYSSAAADLGLTGAANAGVISGSDVNAVEPDGVFSHIAALRTALESNDQAAITAAAGKLKEDYDRVTRTRGETGARVQEIESRQQRLDDQNVATKALLSSLEDTDFTEAIARFQTLQTALQATYQTTANMMNLSLLDFIG
jgi:flagellin-like hook-associated protein FlgL